MKFLLALSPILLLLFLIFWRKLQFLNAAILVLVYTVFVVLFGWSLPPLLIGPAAAKALLLCFDILLIVFGAIVFLNYLRKNGLMRSLAGQLQALAPDFRVQGLLLAWLLGSFIEGTSGFGTPAVVIAPILAGIGFPKITAIAICLIANSTAVSFGAMGTPLRIGFAGLSIDGVPERAAFVNAVVGMIVPVLILALIVRTDSDSRFKRFLEGLPWALFSGAAFLVPYFLFAFLGYEFPSVLGAASGLTLAFLSLRYGFLTPKQVIRLSNYSEAEARFDLVQLGQAISPYVLLLGMLFLGKFAFSGISAPIDLGGGLSHTIQFFNPGLAFLTAVVILSIFRTQHLPSLKEVGIPALVPLGRLGVSIFCIAATTYLMVATGTISQNGMLEVLSAPLESRALPFLSVFVGAFGAFIAGSATVSNLLFGSIQAQAAEALSYPSQWILALQLVGAGAGNMIALPNLLAVEAAVGLRDQESKLIRSLAPPCLLYLLLAGALGFLTVNHLGGHK